MKAALLGLLGLALALPAGAGSLPPALESELAEGLTDNDRFELVAWAMDQPAVKQHLGQDRVKVLRAGANPVKDGAREYRQGCVYVRNYDKGVTHEVRVDLETGRIAIADLLGLVQPSQDEIEDALAVIQRDPVLAPLLTDPNIFVSGGYYDRSPVAADPCSRDICLLIEMMPVGHGRGFQNRVVVNLSRGSIANRNFRHAADETPTPLTDMGGR